MNLSKNETLQVVSENSALTIECSPEGKLIVSSAKGLTKKPVLTVEEYLIQLNSQRNNWLKLYDAWKYRFEMMPAGQKQHHIYTGGLSKHTAQVINLTLYFRDMNKGMLGHISIDDCIIAGFIHDFSKVKMYRKLFPDEKGDMEKQEFKFDNQLGLLDPEMWTMCECMKYGIALTETQINALMYAEGGFSTWTKQKNQPQWSTLAVLLSCADLYSARILGGANL